MLSPDLLAANIQALTRAQGSCPNLGALQKTMRVTVSGGEVSAELCTGGDEWQALDVPPGRAAGDQHWLDVAAAGDGTQAIVVGAGLGHALDRAEQIGLKKVLVIEPDPGLAALLLSRRDWRRWFADGSLRLLTGPDYRGEKDVARFLDGLRDIPIVTNPVRARLEPRAIEQAAAVAGRIADNARANGTARRKFAGPYLLQTLGNLRAIGSSADIAALDGVFRGVPGVIVGAGPSLDENVGQLRHVEDRGVIVCADTALKPLLAGGVRPHIAVGVDSSALNARHLITDAAHGVALAAEGSLHPSALPEFAGRTFMFRVSSHEPWPWLREAGVVRGELRTWGSVLTSAFDLARRMGCNPIIFAGADLAYTGMRPYCRGTIYDAMWQEWIDKGCSWELLMQDYFSRQPEVWMDDLFGVRTRTAPHLVSFRDWIVEQTRHTPDTTFINATGAGILYGGTLRQATLSQALRTLPNRSDLRDIVSRHHTEYCAKSADTAHVSELLARAGTSRTNVPIGRWIDFAAGTITAEQIEAALLSMRDGYPAATAG